MVTLNKKSVAIYLAELADRAARFHLHLKAIEEEFYNPSAALGLGVIPHDKPAFLKSFRACIHTILESAVVLAKTVQTNPEVDLHSIMFAARHAFFCVTRMHEEGLIHLPRPSEPVELRRFCRIISKYVLSVKTQYLAVYVTEQAIDGAYAVDPLQSLKESTVRKLVQLINDLSPPKILAEPLAGEDKMIHVTIPRVDARNPIRWPTLFHEAAHKLLTKEFTGGRDLLESFQTWMHENDPDYELPIGIDLHHWLTEIWCDSVAAFVMGPAFLFSQYIAFISAPPIDSKISRHPPHGFRLRLICVLSRHHYSLIDSKTIRPHVEDCINIVEYWDQHFGVSVETNEDLLSLFQLCQAFFHEVFFSGDRSDRENLRKKLAPMVRYVEAINERGLRAMQKLIAAGLPVSSKPSKSGNVLQEEQSSLQEVILSGWLVRLETMRGEILTTLQTIGDPIDRILSETVIPRIERFDETVLRSLQIGEWLQQLGPVEGVPLDGRLSGLPKARTLAKRIRAMRLSHTLLADHEIVALLRSGELRIMPLVDSRQQLGSTSVDLRLGTSFEVFLPACRRGLDQVESQSSSFDSRRIDLDYLESMMLLPGQFMLAHSFEYLKLPLWVAAELDGRSSYARLGLEVHMTAGMIDPGFEGVVTFELYNGGPNPIQLFPGIRVAQLRFFSISEPAQPYSSKHLAKYRGMLQHNRSLYMNDPDFQRLTGAAKEEAQNYTPETGDDWSI